MPGLDPDLLSDLRTDVAIGRIETDVRSDFILAPHFSAVFTHAREELCDQVVGALRSGAVEASLPITIEVPKPSGLSRPGAILEPSDRLIYQLLADLIAPHAESLLDRARVFSNRLLSPDPDFLMFESSHDGWQSFQAAISDLCDDDNLSYAVKADVSSFFDRLYQHNLINLLKGTGAPSGAVNLLEKMLSAWMEKNSHGIIQGVFPSDLFGNFYLLSADSEFSIRNTPSVRYVDDIYSFYPSREAALRGLTQLIISLRKEGLSLNESKTEICATDELRSGQTRIDYMFYDAWQEVENEARFDNIYGFQARWSPFEAEKEKEDFELKAVERLFSNAESEGGSIADNIDRFCLPLLAASGSDSGIERSLEGLTARPHMAQIYSAYLAENAARIPEITIGVEEMLEAGKFDYDWQMMWAAGVLLKATTVKTETVNILFRVLQDLERADGLRSLCAAAIGKHGNIGQRRNLKHRYASEPSSFVRSAILYASRYFPTGERKTVISAWAGHSRLNALIAVAVGSILKSENG